MQRSRLENLSTAPQKYVAGCFAVERALKGRKFIRSPGQRPGKSCDDPNRALKGRNPLRSHCRMAPLQDLAFRCVQNSQGGALGFRITAPLGLLHSRLITNLN